jgi:hypothetical protein
MGVFVAINYGGVFRVVWTMLEEWKMEFLQGFGSICSIIGLGISIVTLILVQRIRDRVKEHKRHDLYRETISKVLSLPESKQTLPKSSCERIIIMIKRARDYEFSIFFFKHRKQKKLMKDLETELNGDRRLDVLKPDLELLRDEITVR